MRSQIEEKNTEVSNASGEIPQHDVESTIPKEAMIEDSMAKGYVDPTIQLDKAENARLVRKIHWQYVCIITSNTL